PPVGAGGASLVSFTGLAGASLAGSFATATAPAGRAGSGFEGSAPGAGGGVVAACVVSPATAPPGSRLSQMTMSTASTAGHDPATTHQPRDTRCGGRDNAGGGGSVCASGDGSIGRCAVMGNSLVPSSGQISPCANCFLHVGQTRPLGSALAMGSPSPCSESP